MSAMLNDVFSSTKVTENHGNPERFGRKHVLYSSPPSPAYIRQWTTSALVQIMACRLAGTKLVIWTNAEILLIGPLETNYSKIIIKISIFSLKKMHLKLSSGKMVAFLSSGRWVNFFIRDMPAGGLALLGVKTYAVTVMTKLRSCI